MHSARNSLNLRFDGMAYSAWIDRASFHARTDRLINEAKNRSQRQNLSSNALETAIRQLETAGFHPREVCNGADLIEILSIGLRSKLGNNSPSEVRVDILRRSLRLTYTEQEFTMSTLGRDIRVWESQSDWVPSPSTIIPAYGRPGYGCLMLIPHQPPKSAP